MSRKMLSRGRYPKDAYLYSGQAPVRQSPQPVASTSASYTQPPEVPLYNPQSMQQGHQSFQNSWPSAPFSAAEGRHQQSQQQNSWAHQPPYTQTSENNVWNWTPENNMYSQNVQPVQQHYHYSELSNLSAQHPNNAASHSYYSPTNLPSEQPANANYTTSNEWRTEGATESSAKNGNKPMEQLPQTSWEAVTANISQAEHLPWTYSVPQNATTTTADSLAHWPNNPLPQNTAYETITPNWTAPPGNGWQEVRNSEVQRVEFSNGNLVQQNPTIENSTFVPYQGTQHSQDSNSGYGGSANDIENIESCTVNNYKSDVPVSENVSEVAESESSGLNAFFHHTVEENAEVMHKVQAGEVIQESQLSPANDENVSMLPLPDHQTPLYSVNQLESGEVADSTISGGALEDCVSYEQNQAQPMTESLDNPAILPAEEPLNQEVPEPYSAHGVALSQQIAHDDSLDEPLNQQVPAETAVSTTVLDRSGIAHEESSPFKHPAQSCSVVQLENISYLPKPSSQTGFQEVNLETVPDNLERPPDSDDLRKESALSASFRQHLRSAEEESVSDKSKTSLWEDPKLPCILLAPAAPLQPKAPSPAEIDKASTPAPQVVEQSKSSDVNSITTSLHDLHIKDPTNSPHPSEGKEHSSTASPVADVYIAQNSTVPKSNSETVKNTMAQYVKVDSQPSKTNSQPIQTNLHPVKANSLPEKANSETSKVSREYMKTGPDISKPVHTTNVSPASLRASPTKDPYQSLSSTDVAQCERYPPAPQNIERDRHSRSYTDMRGRPLPPDFEQDPHSSKYSYKSLDRYPDRRYMDSRYSSFDERQSFNREGSRPSSRMSLDESSESHGIREHSYRKNYGSDYDRPPSRMSESEAYRAHREGLPPYFEPHYNSSAYNREEYYHRMRGYRGYDYDPYQQARPYYGYYDPYNYNYSSYNYGFYDELYRNDPRYRKQLDDQYREYYKRLGYETDYEKSSAYSGRSSVNELSKDVSQRYTENDASSSDIHYQNYEQESQLSSCEASDGKQSTPISRLTPIKFNSPHAFISCMPPGQLLTFVPSKYNTGLPPLIEIHDMQSFCQESESYKELKQFQGPLVRRETHKNDIIDFCMQKVKFYKQKEGIHDRESYILLWELLILLLRQNGSVAGSDIAELLLKDHEVLRPALLHHTSDIPHSDSSPAEAGEVPNPAAPAGDASSPDEGIVVTRDKTILNSAQCFDMDKVTRKFREFLLFGHKKDALEWAMKHNLWGHALFLASKMDVRTYANVMTRFANSLALNDPLQTLYQLMSGRQPAAVTCIADKQWGDWRPHLAMILSNPSSHSEVDLKSITTLGDTLAAQGCLPATHFCYLMAQVEFGNYFCKSSKMVLLLADHQQPFDKFATNEAIQCTEIYEYAQSLANPGFILNHLQTYKFIYATRLLDHGFPQEALHYCEVLTTSFLSNPNAFSSDLIKQVYELASQLKYYDPHYMQGQGEVEDQEDPEWLRTLASLLGVVQQENQSYNEECPEQPAEMQNNAESYQQIAGVDSVQEVSANEGMNENYSIQQNPNLYSNAWITGNVLQQQQQQPQYTELNSHDHQFQPSEVTKQNQVGYPMQWGVTSQKPQEMYYENQTAKSHEEIQSSQSPPTSSQKFNFYGTDPQMPMRHSKERTSSTSSIGLAKDRRDSALSSGSDFGSSGRKGSKNIAEAKSEDKVEKARPQVGRSWLGGIFSKLLPKAPNQMILPDDKNPTIVWDPVENRWINTDSKDDDINSQPSAPPRDAELNSKSPEPAGMVSMPPVAAASTPVANKFQRQKVKGMRQNYVDILNPTSPSTESPSSSDILFPTMPPTLSGTKMFVPSAPVSSDPPTDFVSAQSYTYNATESNENVMPLAPPMFDPAEFDTRRSSINTVRHSVGPAHRTYPT